MFTDSGPDRLVDVRALEEPPFDAIVAALGRLDVGETVEFVTGFAPVPLYDALDDRGWSYEAVRKAPDEWHVHVTATAADGDHSGERLRRPRTDRLPTHA